MDRIQAAYWWRFSKYEIRNEAICPAEGATLEPYDPWEAFEDARAGNQPSGQGKRIIEPPYRQLFSVVRENKKKKQVTYDDALIIDWCSRFGLLGILPHRVHSITLPARWGTTEDSRDRRMWRKFHGIEGERLLPVVTQHVRTPTGWSSSRHPFPPMRGTEGRLGAAVDESGLLPDWPQPGIIWAGLTEMTPSADSLGKLGPFFRVVSSREAEYPMPLSPSFWEVYAEPLYEFQNAVDLLSYSVKTIALLKKKPGGELRGADGVRLLNAVQKLNALAAPVCVSLSPSSDGSKLVQKWAGPSLLSSLALMALLDLAEGLLRSCGNCSGAFVTSAYQGTYCSKKCRETALKRLLRKRQKAAVAMHNDGMPIGAIAMQVGSRAKTVKGWINKKTAPKKTRTARGR